MAKDCWYCKEKEASKSKDVKEANIAYEDLDGCEIMVLMDAVSDEGLNSKTWFLDTGCSNHMIGHKSL